MCSLRDRTSGLLGPGWDIGRAGAGECERLDDPVEQFLGDSLGQGGLLEGQVVVDGTLEDGGGLVIADHWGQRGDHHDRPVDVLLQLGLVESGALDHELAEVVAHIGQDHRRVQVVADQRRSLAILNKVTAASLRPLCARTMRSSVPCAANLFAAVRRIGR